jgi:hypothetical protein
MADLEDDDLELDEQGNPKPKQGPLQPIGTPIVPSPSSKFRGGGSFQDVRPIMPQPQSTTPAIAPIAPDSAVPPSPSGGSSIGTPIGPAAPRPRQDELQQGMQPGGRLTTPSYMLPSTDPNYEHHPFKKFFNVLGSAFPIGQAIEAGGGFGTFGHDVNRMRAEREATEENAGITEGEKERQAGAALEETGARTDAEKALAESRRAGMESVMITLPSGQVMTVPKSQLGPDVRAMITEQGAGQRTAATNTSKEGIAAAGNESKESIAGAKPQPHVITMQNGKPHVMERNPQTKEYSIDRGEAPPNYASTGPQTHTVELLGEDNVMHRFQYNPTSGSFDKDMGPAPTGQAAHQIFQAGAIEKLVPQIVSDINAHREVLGKLSSYYKQWLSGTPIADPIAAQMMGELMSLAATQPALHAFRSTNAMQGFENMIGGLAKDPDATIATINGLMKTPEAFTSLPQRGGGAGGPARPKGVPQEAVWNAKDKQWQMPNKQ